MKKLYDPTEKIKKGDLVVGDLLIGVVIEDKD